MITSISLFLSYLLIAFITWFVLVYINLKYDLFGILLLHTDDIDEKLMSFTSLVLALLWPFSIIIIGWCYITYYIFRLIGKFISFMPWFVRKCFHGEYL